MGEFPITSAGSLKGDSTQGYSHLNRNIISGKYVWHSS